MKKITSIIALVATSFFATAQNVDYNFNTENDLEGWTQSGVSASVGTEGAVEITFTGGFAGLRGPEGLAINESDYQYVVVSAENATNNTEWQIVNHDAGDTNFGNGEKTNFTMPTVTAGAGYSSFVIAIPSNGDNVAGAIDRISIRTKIGTAPTGTLKIDRFTIIEAENDFVSNADFESMVSSVAPWTTSGGETSVAFTSIASEGTQAAEITFDADQTKNQFLDNVVYDFGETITPDNINATFDVRATNTNVEFQVQYDLLNAADENVGTPNTGLSSVSAVNVYEPFEFNKANAVSFNKIRFRFKIKTATDKNAVTGDKFYLDNVKVTLTNTTLSQSELEQEINFGLYPNPVANVLNVNADANVKSIEVLNLIGQVVAVANNATAINVAKLNGGVYIARIITDKGVIAKRIVKQ